MSCDDEVDAVADEERLEGRPQFRRRADAVVVVVRRAVERPVHQHDDPGRDVAVHAGELRFEVGVLLAARRVVVLRADEDRHDDAQTYVVPHGPARSVHREARLVARVGVPVLLVPYRDVVGDRGRDGLELSEVAVVRALVDRAFDVGDVARVEQRVERADGSHERRDRRVAAAGLVAVRAEVGDERERDGSLRDAPRGLPGAERKVAAAGPVAAAVRRRGRGQLRAVDEARPAAGGVGRGLSCEILGADVDDGLGAFVGTHGDEGDHELVAVRDAQVHLLRNDGRSQREAAHHQEIGTHHFGSVFKLGEWLQRRIQLTSSKTTSDGSPGLRYQTTPRPTSP